MRRLFLLSQETSPVDHRDGRDLQLLSRAASALFRGRLLGDGAGARVAGKATGGVGVGDFVVPSAALDPPAAARILSALPLGRDAIRAVLDAAGAPPADLTERDLQVLQRLAVGQTKREIAAEMVISPSTVHTHTVHNYAKCGVSTRAALAIFAMQHGLAAILL